MRRNPVFACMGPLPATLALAAVFVVTPATAPAAVHDVTVNSMSFSPNDLTIQAGDTVRWTLTGSGGSNCNPYYGCGGEREGPAHSIVADDGSFSSGAPADNFVYQHTFPVAGEVRYHCGQHSEPGRDIAQFMNGRIVIESSHNEPAFQINAGLNDAWYNPAVGGQGFFITVFPDIARMFVAWFTFEVERPDAAVAAQLGDAGHRWITAFGAYTGNEAVLEIEVTSGGVFDAGQPVPVSHSDGTLVLEFEHCNAATVTYEIPSLGLSGSVPIQRLANDNLPACEAAD